MIYPVPATPCTPYPVAGALPILPASTSLHCSLQVWTPSDAYYCLFLAVYPTAPPICPPGAVLLPPSHDPALLSRVTTKMPSCSFAPCCHQYLLPPYSASPLLSCCCCHLPAFLALLLPEVVPSASCCLLQWPLPPFDLAAGHSTLPAVSLSPAVACHSLSFSKRTPSS